MDGTNLTTRTTGVLAAVAMAVGLAGVTVSACSLTSPNRFQNDTSMNSDSAPGAERLGAADLDAEAIALRLARAETPGG